MFYFGGFGLHYFVQIKHLDSASHRSPCPIIGHGNQVILNGLAGRLTVARTEQEMLAGCDGSQNVRGGAGVPGGEHRRRECRKTPRAHPEGLSAG